MAETFDQYKFEAMVLYIAFKSNEDPRCGATKLNKLLFYSDVGAYRVLGHSISGATYRHLQAGPVPKEIQTVRESLVDRGLVVDEQRPYFEGHQRRLLVDEEPDVSCLSEPQLALIDQVVDAFKWYSASAISEYSHQEPAWKITGLREDIPYPLTMLSKEPLLPEEEDFGQELAESLGLTT